MAISQTKLTKSFFMTSASCVMQVANKRCHLLSQLQSSELLFQTASTQSCCIVILLLLYLLINLICQSHLLQLLFSTVNQPLPGF